MLLEIKNLHANVGGKEILKGIDLCIGPGEVHAVMGPNGAGKSTLGAVLTGRPGYEVTEGSVLYNGKDLLAMAPAFSMVKVDEIPTAMENTEYTIVRSVEKVVRDGQVIIRLQTQNGATIEYNIQGNQITTK